MKVRIKITENNNGMKHYMPQARRDVTIVGIFISIGTLMFFGKSWIRYYSLKKSDNADIYDKMFGIKPGEIIQCSDELAGYLNYDQAKKLLDEYVLQEKSKIDLAKKEAEENKRIKKEAKHKVKSQKPKHITYTDVMKIK